MEKPPVVDNAVDLKPFKSIAEAREWLQHEIVAEQRCASDRRGLAGLEPAGRASAYARTLHKLRAL